MMTTMISHTKMTGGAFRLTIDQEMRFRKAYAKRCMDIDKERTWVERVTSPTFYMFLDLDIKREVDTSEILALSLGACRVLGAKRALISTPGPTCSNGQWKTGIHVNTNMVVDVEKATKLVAQLREIDDFKSIVDESPYKNGGLRMLWSYKGDGGPPYVPYKIVDENGGLLDIDYDTPSQRLDILNEFSVRHLTNTPKANACRVNIPDATLSAINTFIRKCWPEFPSFRITSMQPGKQRTVYIQVDTRYCLNIKRCHNSNHAYFIIRLESGSWTIQQRCFSKTGSCDGFHSRSYNVSAPLVRDLKARGLI